MAFLSVVTITLIVFSTVIFGYTTYWYIAASEITKRINEWASIQNTLGNKIVFEDISTRGFPLNLDIQIEKPEIEISDSDLIIATKRFHISLEPWNFRRINITPDKETWAKTTNNGLIETYLIKLASGRVEITRDGKYLRDIHTQLFDISLESPISKEPTLVSYLQLKIQVLGSHKSQELNAPLVNTTLNLEKIVLPDGFGEDMGEYIDHLDISTSLFGTISDDEPNNTMKRWRDSGGFLDINSLRGRWGPLELEASGTMTLDEHERPLAAIAADVTGYGDMIDALIMSNAIPLGDAFIAKVAFNMLAEEKPDGSRQLNAIPLTIQDGILSVGPMNVTSVDPITF